MMRERPLRFRSGLSQYRGDRSALGGEADAIGRKTDMIRSKEAVTGANPAGLQYRHCRDIDVTLPKS